MLRRRVLSVGNVVCITPLRITREPYVQGLPYKGFFLLDNNVVSSDLTRFDNKSVNLPYCALLKRGPELKDYPPRVT